MTNELEKQFFQCFEIEPSGKKCTCDVRDFAKCTTYYCTSCEKALEKVYPQITDTHYLKLICILNTVTAPDLGDINTSRLKKTILEECINALTKVDWENRTPTKEEFIKEIQTLFEEG